MRQLLGYIVAYFRRLRTRLSSGGFAGNVATVATGTGAAIGVNLLAAPILTRLYTPEEFGLFAAFLSVSSILAVGAAGRYELAVVLASTQVEARRLVVACLGLSLLCTVGLSLLLVGLDSRIVAASDFDALLLWLLPPFTLLLALGQAASNWLNWGKSYVHLGYGRTTRNAAAAGAQVGLAFPGLGSIGLAAGRVLGEIAFLIVTGWRFVRNNVLSRDDLRPEHLLRLLKKHIRFPLYTLPSAVINKTNAELPEILLLALFEPRAAGLYALTRRAVDRPLGFLSNSVREVFYRRFAESRQEGEDMGGLLLRATLGMIAVVTPPITIGMLLAPDLVVWVFGAEWQEASAYIRVLAPAIAVHLVVRSTGLSMYVMEKQKVVLWWTSGFLVLSTAGLALGQWLGGALLAVGILSAVRIAMYLIYFALNLHFARTTEFAGAVTRQALKEGRS